MSEKMMIALTGGFRGSREPCGMMEEGFCIPLAATDAVATLIESVGEDCVAELLREADVDEPPAGGIWVAEIDLVASPVDDEDLGAITDVRWRHPTADEWTGLMLKQNARAHGRRDEEPPRGEARWVFSGARV